MLAESPAVENNSAWVENSGKLITGLPKTNDWHWTCSYPMG